MPQGQRRRVLAHRRRAFLRHGHQNFVLARFLKSILGSELLFVLFCCAFVFFSGVLPMFFLCSLCFIVPENAWQKIIFFLGLVFEKAFSGANFCFCCFVVF